MVILREFVADMVMDNSGAPHTAENAPDFGFVADACSQTHALMIKWN